ncbi:transposase [Corynebacterium diphtheriae]|nr:transposase [Corynebacterium diphtheriae]MBG9294091.1 transposase [Corynebacterium diphtheriae bv. mitis]MBG9304330.1 transposase [Corynebacterium diphtheriae bv. mitis]MBG9306482.1 transposase [Corynebacterium diphtheriae bv. mitis]OMO45294.1 hypothetical protein BVL37_11665 [Corynebacterium diphtheriae]OMO45863.1 hypothetical protein BVL40_11695 [Corynebacterium diphtheriae]
MSKLYSEQFKADAVALVESGISRRQVCADLGISRSSLQKWITDARLQAQGMQPCADPVVAKEMRQALKRFASWRWKTKCYVQRRRTCLKR